MKKRLGDEKMRTKLAAILNLTEDAERLQPLTEQRPVASLPFGCRYWLIDFPFSSLYNAEVISAALFISGSGHSLYDHIRSGSTWGLDSPIGGGVFTHSHIEWKWEIAKRENIDVTYYDNHRGYVERANTDHVLITGSGILCNVNLDSVIQYHETKRNPITALFKNVTRASLPEETNVLRYVVNSGQAENVTKVESMNEVPMDAPKVAAGMDMVLMDTEFFLEYLDYADENMKEVSAATAVAYALKQDVLISAYEYTGYMKSIEDIQTYYEANMDMLDENNFNSLFYRNEPVVTRTRHGAPTYYGATSNVTNSQLASDCEVYGNVKNSLIFRKSKIAEGATVSDSVLMQGAEIGKDVVLKHVIFDKKVRVEDGVHLEGTPDNPIVIKKNTVITKENVKENVQ